MAISKNRTENSKGRFYYITGKNGEQLSFPSVSTVLEVLGKPWLMKWYGKLGVTEAERIKLDTANVGTCVHAIIERICNKETIQAPEWNALDDRIKNGVRGYVRWANQSGYIPRQSETTVYSLKNKYAGTLDGMGLVKNHSVLVDWKVTGGIPAEVVMQLAAYREAYLEMYPGRKISDIRCIRFGRDTGDFEERIYLPEDTAPAFEAFLQCRKLWDYLNKIRSEEDAKRNC